MNNKGKILLFGFVIVMLSVAILLSLMFYNYNQFSLYSYKEYDDYNIMLEDLPYYAVMPRFDENLAYQEMYIVYEKPSKLFSGNDNYLANSLVITDKYTIDCRFTNLGMINPLKRHNYEDTIYIGSIPVYIFYEQKELDGIKRSDLIFLAILNMQTIIIYDYAKDIDPDEHYNSGYAIIYEAMESMLIEYSERIIW